MSKQHLPNWSSETKANLKLALWKTFYFSTQKQPLLGDQDKPLQLESPQFSLSTLVVECPSYKRRQTADVSRDCKGWGGGMFLPCQSIPLTWRPCPGWKAFLRAWTRPPKQSTPWPWSCTPGCPHPVYASHKTRSQSASLQTAVWRRTVDQIIFETQDFQEQLCWVQLRIWTIDHIHKT